MFAAGSGSTVFALGWRRVPAARSSSDAERAAASVSLRRRATEMQRRHRLSRSRDFDAVYRHGRSVSTRFLTLYWFAREDDGNGDPRLGLSGPKKAVGRAGARNR